MRSEVEVLFPPPQNAEGRPGRRSWEDDYVLKQAFSSLVPAFDPRPGRTNVPQIQDFDVPPPGSDVVQGGVASLPTPSPQAVKLALTIKVGVAAMGGEASAVR